MKKNIIGLSIMTLLMTLVFSAGSISISAAESADIINENNDTFSEQFECDHDNITVSVDASMYTSLPEFTSINVSPYTITSDDMKRWSDILFDGEIAYNADYRLTKKDLQDQIESLNVHCDYDKLMEEYKNEWDVRVMQIYYRYLIKEYEQMLDTAPDEKEKQSTDWHFRPYVEYAEGFFPVDEEDDYFYKTHKLEVVCDRDDGRINHIEATNRNDGDNRCNSIYAYSDSDTVLPAKDISEEKAVEMANDLLKRMDLADWKIWSLEASMNGDHSEYLLKYVPVYEGMQMLAANGTVYNMVDTEGMTYEKPTINILVEGDAVTRFELTSPMIMETINAESAEYAEPAAVYETFRKFMQTDYTIGSYIEFGGEDAEKAHDIDIKVDNIMQGLFRIKDGDHYVMVPAWAFYGDVFVDNDSWGLTDLCVINAVNAEIIDVKDCY